jgi:hypothetical protein
MYLARVAALDAGVAQEAPALTLNRLCGSELQAIVSAADWSVTIPHLGGRPAPRDLVERGARVVILDRDNAGELCARCTRRRSTRY